MGASIYLMTSAATSFTLALIIVHLHYSCVTSQPRQQHKQDTPTALYKMYLPERCTTSSLTGFNKGVIISQRGEKYAPDTRCTLNLRVRSSARAIRFTFEHMDLPEVRSGHCEDYVQFYTPSPDTDVVSDAESSVAGPFCGRTLPHDFYSNGTSVLVRFTSNSNRERSGFRFRFERVSYSVDLCTGSGCSDVSVHRVAEYPTDVDWSLLSRYCCYVVLVVVGLYTLWQHRSTSWQFCCVIAISLRRPRSSTGILPK